MSSVSEPMSTPSVRALVRWGLPLHWVVPAACGLLGVLLLLVGGTVAVFGGWWLATALPVAIGGFHSGRRAALVPVAVWIAWCLVGVAAGGDAGLANTPPALAVLMAILGGSATLLAQRAVFPATDPEVWEHHGDHEEPAAEAGPGTAAAEPVVLGDDEDLDPALADAFELDEDETVAGDEAEVEDEAPELDEEESAGPEAVEDETPEADEDETPEAEADDEPADEEPEPELAVEAEPEPEPEPEPEASKRPSELPLGADPAPLDEGGHPTEFAAISDDDA